MVRSEAQPGSTRAGNKRPKDNSSEGTSPGHKPSSHKKHATQRDQIEGDPKRLELNAENQQGVLLLAEAPAHDKQPESQPASEVDAVSVAGSRSDHGEAAPAKTHEENTGHNASNAAPLHWVQFNCPPEHRGKVTLETWAINVNYCLMELTDTEREGDNFKDVLPDRPKQCDGSKTGPNPSGFRTSDTGRLSQVRVSGRFHTCPPFGLGLAGGFGRVAARIPAKYPYPVPCRPSHVPSSAIMIGDI